MICTAESASRSVSAGVTAAPEPQVVRRWLGCAFVSDEPPLHRSEELSSLIKKLSPHPDLNF